MRALGHFFELGELTEQHFERLERFDCLRDHLSSRWHGRGGLLLGRSHHASAPAP